MKYQAIIQDSTIGRFRAFTSATEILSTHDISEVKPLLEKVDSLVKSGLWAVGFLSYEASPAFDSSAVVKEDNNFPKAWYALFNESEIIDLPKSNNNFYLGPWQAEIDRDGYHEAISRIKNHIKRGDSYQTNFTFRQHASFQGDPFDCFLAFVSRQTTSYAAYINCGDFSICSASPELFYINQGSKILTKPMKGTAARSDEPEQDQKRSHDLKNSPKERSENIMIVDLIRNDLSRIAIDKSVRPVSLFDVEPFETLWQMTSTIEAQSDRTSSEIIEALYPCASITGAPKGRTMRIIAELEKSPRQIYTGSIGLIYPGAAQTAQFNVAIRTILLDHSSNLASYGTGSGILWDCDISKEYQECLLKSRATPNSPEGLELLETMLWTPDNGIYLLDAHIERLEKSARYFGYKYEPGKINKFLAEQTINLPDRNQKLRLLLSFAGSIRLENCDLPSIGKALRLVLAKSPVDSANIFLYHKTTERSLYQKAMAENPGFDDVILWNERGEITETCIGNIAFRFGSRWYTPPLHCGILDGVYRKSLLDKHKIEERILMLEDINKVDELAVLNSVRTWSEASIIPRQI